MPKKEFTSFDVAAVVQELKDAIAGSRVSNVYQTDAKTIVLKLHKPDKPNLQLILEAGRRLHQTSYFLEKPTVPPAFCMALRKYLRGSFLENVEQYEFERVVIFHFKTKLEVMRLVLELFGEGNIVLVNENNVILQALSYKRMSDRNILRNETFSFAPPIGRNPLTMTEKEFQQSLQNFPDMEIVRALARYFSLGGIYAEEALLSAQIDKNNPCSTLKEDETAALFRAIKEMLSKATTDKKEPNIVKAQDGSLIDVNPFKLRRYANQVLQPCETFNIALDEFFTKTETIEKTMAKMNVEKLKNEEERLKRIIEEQEKTLVSAERDVAQNKHIGDLIYAHSNELQALIEKFQTAKQNGKEWKNVVSELLAEKKANLKPSSFFESFDAKNLIVNVQLNNIMFGLDLRKTLFENAARFYENSKRAKQKMMGAEAALKESQKKLEEIQQKILETETLKLHETAETEQKLAKIKTRPREWFEKFRWFISSDGFLVVAGKDAVSNEVLIKKHTEDTDIVFHADIVGAPFAVVKTEKRNPSDQTLKEAAEFAAAFSRGWREGFGTVDVYWVKPKQLSKGGPSGEYVPKGAFVVSGQRNWMRSVPLKIALGAVEKDETISIVGGPVEAVKAKTKNYVKIGPGDVKGKELFRQVLKALASKMPMGKREKTLQVSVEDIRLHVPYGKGRILAE